LCVLNWLYSRSESSGVRSSVLKLLTLCSKSLIFLAIALSEHPQSFLDCFLDCSLDCLLGETTFFTAFFTACLTTLLTDGDKLDAF